ncbi:MAG: hypothetical protein KJ879_02045 [Nanoarchaeota archaeon]|nr:hypothetical protein [Nanoarchaeota archaeon]
MVKKFFILPVISFFFLKLVSAHCPLCTIGAGAAAAGAVWLGVSKVVVALFIGAFAMSMGLWFSNIIKKQYIQFQKTLIVIVVFLTTVWPLMPLFSAIGPLYLSFMGEYGITYAVNYSIASSLFGGLVVLSSPLISKKLTKLREGKMLPFQGIIITLSTLIIAGSIIQVLV